MTEAEPFETLVRLYLEENGYSASTNLPIPLKEGGGDVDIFALHPGRDKGIIGFCVTNTYGIPAREWGRQMQKQKLFILTRYPSLTGNLEFWYFTLWMGANEKQKRVSLERLGFQRVIGPSEFRKFLRRLIQKYRLAWERERKIGPRKESPSDGP